MHELARQTLVPTAMQQMAEPVALWIKWPPASLNPTPVVLPALVRVTEQDNRSYGHSVVMRAELLFADSEGDSVAEQIGQLLTTVQRVSFRGQHFTIVSVGPVGPEGLIRVQAENVLRTVTNSPKLNSRR